MQDDEDAGGVEVGEVREVEPVRVVVGGDVPVAEKDLLRGWSCVGGVEHTWGGEAEDGVGVGVVDPREGVGAEFGDAGG